MKRLIVCFVILLSICQLSANAGILPSFDEVFGDKPMPTIAQAINREADMETETAEGTVQSYYNFTQAEYNSFSTYLKEQNCQVIGYETNNGVLTVDLEKDGISFRFIYDKGKSEANVIYYDGGVPEPFATATPTPRPTNTPSSVATVTPTTTLKPTNTPNPTAMVKPTATPSRNTLTSKNEFPVSLVYISQYKGLKLTDMRYEFESRYSGNYNLKIYLTGEMTYIADNYAIQAAIGWRLRDEQGYLIKSGVWYTDSLMNGDKFRAKEYTIYDISSGNYTIEFLKVS